MENALNTLEIKYCGIFEIEFQPEEEIDESSGDREIFDCFKYNDETWRLDEFMSLHNPVHCPHPPKEFKGFDGYMSTSFFDGYLIKIIESGDAIKLYHYLS